MDCDDLLPGTFLNFFLSMMSTLLWSYLFFFSPLFSRPRAGVATVCVCVCVCFPLIYYSGRQAACGRTSRGHTATGGRSHRISHPSSFCGACFNFSREKDPAVPFSRRP